MRDRTELPPKEAFPKTLELSCPDCGASEFGLHVLKDDGLAAARCINCERNYLLLDSEDYWFDVIQAGYPRASRCACKSTSFKLRCDYAYRDDGDVEEIKVWSTCTACDKTKRQMSIDIDYGDTGDLVTRPLRYCKNPKILYDLKDMSLYVTREDMAEIADYLHSALRCTFVCWLREQDEWVQSNPNAREVKEIILACDGGQVSRYLRIYALPRPVEVVESEVYTAMKEASFWKQREVIRISSPTHMNVQGGEGLLYYISFANEYVVEEKIIQKSPEFRHVTGNFLAWLKAKFVSWRGPLCFDNPAENVRLFGDRFAKGRQG